jgi:hypothetical protein
MWTICPLSAFSGYHTDFHEGHGTAGERQGRRLACVNCLKIPFFKLFKSTGYVMHQQAEHSTSVRSAHAEVVSFVSI